MNKVDLRSDQSQSSVSIVPLKSQSSQQNKVRSEKMKNCCRIFVELMFTQVTITVKLIPNICNELGWCWMSFNKLYNCWSICISIFRNIGACQHYCSSEQEKCFLFYFLISPGKVTETRNSAVINLWNTTDTYNTLNPKLWQSKTNEILQEYQLNIIRKVKEGYDTRTVKCSQKFIFMWC